MERTRVSSSNINSIGYDEASGVLEVEFKGGAVYQYSGVSYSTYRKLMDATSHGKSFNQLIKDKFPAVQVR